METKPRPANPRIQAVAILAVTAAIAGGLLVPEIAIGAGVILGIAGCLDWLRDPP
jgi:hypothetical protein